MNGTWINGRLATEAEATAVGHGYRCAHERDLRLLAGLLSEVPRRPEALAGRPVTDILPSIP
jgi:hypothetical protein